MAEIAVVFFVATAHRYDFDLGRVKLSGGAKVFLRFAKALAPFALFRDRQEHIGHSIIIAGVKEVLPRGCVMARCERRFGARFGLLGQRQPFALPSVFIASLDVLHRAGDIEDIAAALLRLGDETQGMAPEGMIRKKKIEHHTSDTSN